MYVVYIEMSKKTCIYEWRKFVKKWTKWDMITLKANHEKKTSFQKMVINIVAKSFLKMLKMTPNYMQLIL